MALVPRSAGIRKSAGICWCWQVCRSHWRKTEPNTWGTAISFGHLTGWLWTSYLMSLRLYFIISRVKCPFMVTANDDNCPNCSTSPSLCLSHSVLQSLARKPSLHRLQPRPAPYGEAWIRWHMDRVPDLFQEKDSILIPEQEEEFPHWTLFCLTYVTTTTIKSAACQVTRNPKVFCFF